MPASTGATSPMWCASSIRSRRRGSWGRSTRSWPSWALSGRRLRACLRDRGASGVPATPSVRRPSAPSPSRPPIPTSSGPGPAPPAREATSHRATACTNPPMPATAGGTWGSRRPARSVGSSSTPAMPTSCTLRSSATSSPPTRNEGSTERPTVASVGARFSLFRMKPVRSISPWMRPTHGCSMRRSGRRGAPRGT